MDIFPKDIPGLSWSIMRAPRFATRAQMSVSGRRLAVPDYSFPIWTWTLTYDFLRDQHDIRFPGGIGKGFEELRELIGFFTRQQGSFNTFLYDDPSDDFVTNQGIGVGDGTSTAFQLLRTLSAPSYGGLFTENITQPGVITAVYVNSASVPYSLGSFGVVNLNSAPPLGALVTWTGAYYWPVHFVEDTYEFENFMYQLWNLKKITFESVLLP